MNSKEDIVTENQLLLSAGWYEDYQESESYNELNTLIREYLIRAIEYICENRNNNIENKTRSEILLKFTKNDIGRIFFTAQDESLKDFANKIKLNLLNSESLMALYESYYDDTLISLNTHTLTHFKTYFKTVFDNLFSDTINTAMMDGYSNDDSSLQSACSLVLNQLLYKYFSCIADSKKAEEDVRRQVEKDELYRIYERKYGIELKPKIASKRNKMEDEIDEKYLCILNDYQRKSDIINLCIKANNDKELKGEIIFRYVRKYQNQNQKHNGLTKDGFKRYCLNNYIYIFDKNEQKILLEATKDAVKSYNSLPVLDNMPSPLNYIVSRLHQHIGLVSPDFTNNMTPEEPKTYKEVDSTDSKISRLLKSNSDQYSGIGFFKPVNYPSGFMAELSEKIHKGCKQ